MFLFLDITLLWPKFVARIRQSNYSPVMKQLVSWTMKQRQMKQITVSIGWRSRRVPQWLVQILRVSTLFLHLFFLFKFLTKAHKVSTSGVVIACLNNSTSIWRDRSCVALTGLMCHGRPGVPLGKNPHARDRSWMTLFPWGLCAATVSTEQGRAEQGFSFGIRRSKVRCYWDPASGWKGRRTWLHQQRL